MKNDIENDLEGFEAPPSARSFMQVLWQRKAFVILGAIVGLAAGFLWYTQKTTRYQSGTAVLVNKEQPTGNGANLQNMANFVEMYMPTQLLVIRSPAVIQRAIKDGKLAELPAFEGRDAESSIQTRLVAMRDNDRTGGAPNNIIQLTFQCEVAEDCQKVLTAITDAYEVTLDEWLQSTNSKNLEGLRRRQKELAFEIKATEQKFEKFRKANDRISEFSDKGMHPLYIEIGSSEAEKVKVQREQENLKENLEMFKNAADEKEERDIAKLIFGKGDYEFKKLEEDKHGLIEMLGAELLILKLGLEVGEGHPSYDAAVKSRDKMKEIFDKTRPKTLGEKDPVKELKTRLAFEQKIIKSRLKKIEEHLTAKRVEAKQLTSLQIEDATLRRQLDGFYKSQDATEKLIFEYELTEKSNTSGRITVKVLNPAGIGGKVYPVLVTDMGLGMILGLMIGIGLAYLADFADKSFRSPEEIRKQMGLPLVGHIPFFLPDADAAKRRAAGETTIDPMLCTYFKPKSLDSEAYRAVRTSMFFSTQAQDLKVIQVTSPNKGDGKSLLISNLAITTAQSGKRVLLIDADCRRPRQHKVLNLGNSAGLVTVLTGQATPSEVIQDTVVPGLSVMTSGPVPPNPSELLVSPLFKEMLDSLREQYDYVFIDTPPLLAVTDPCVVAGKVDGLFLAIRLTRRGQPDAVRAREILASLKVRTFGIVVNGVTRTNAGLYSSQAYDYTDKYMDYENDEDQAYYYADDDEEAAAEAAAEKARK